MLLCIIRPNVKVKSIKQKVPGMFGMLKKRRRFYFSFFPNKIIELNLKTTFFSSETFISIKENFIFAFRLSLWFIVIVNVRPLSVCL